MCAATSSRRAPRFTSRAAAAATTGFASDLPAVCTQYICYSCVRALVATILIEFTIAAKRRTHGSCSACGADDSEGGGAVGLCSLHRRRAHLIRQASATRASDSPRLKRSPPMSPSPLIADRYFLWCFRCVTVRIAGCGYGGYPVPRQRRRPSSWCAAAGQRARGPSMQSAAGAPAASPTDATRARACRDASRRPRRRRRPRPPRTRSCQSRSGAGHGSTHAAHRPRVRMMAMIRSYALGRTHGL